MKKYSKKDHILFAIWAADISERFLPLFEKNYPKDKRPKRAIKELRKWIKTGEFKMSVIRKASLDAHKAAKKAGKEEVGFAAHATGQAVATCHVPQHAFGASYYILKIIVANSKNNEDAKNELNKEIKYRLNHLPKHLRKDFKIFLKLKLPKNIKGLINQKH